MACIKKRRNKWVVDWRDENGKRHWETKADKKKAQDRLSEILKGENVEQVLERRTFKEYGDWWLQNVAKGTISESTYEEYARDLRIHVYPVLGEKRFADIKRADIRELIGTKKDAGLAQSTIKNIVAPVRGMFNQAIEDDAISRNPAARIGKLNKVSKDKPKKKIDPLNREEIQTLLKTALEKHPHYYSLLLCACRTGLRMGELLALKGSDLDFNSRFVHVQRNFYRGKNKSTKSGRDRRVDMSKTLAGVLDELLSVRRSKALQEEMKKPADERRDRDVIKNEIEEDWLFQTPVIARSELAERRRPGMEPRGGTQLDPANLRKAFFRSLTAAGLRRVRFHDLRHSFASLLLENRESLTYVKEQMGHSSINVTVDIYGHLVPGGNRQAVDRLDDAVKASETAAR